MRAFQLRCHRQATTTHATNPNKTLPLPLREGGGGRGRGRREALVSRQPSSATPPTLTLPRTSRSAATDRGMGEGKINVRTFINVRPHPELVEGWGSTFKKLVMPGLGPGIHSAETPSLDSIDGTQTIRGSPGQVYGPGTLSTPVRRHDRHLFSWSSPTRQPDGHRRRRRTDRRSHRVARRDARRRRPAELSGADP